MSTPSDRTIGFRAATADDLCAIVILLANDPLGSQRETLSDPLDPAYVEAFDAIDADPNQHLQVAEADGMIVGCLQLTVIPYLTYKGGRRALVEGVRVAGSHRGSGLGRSLLEHAIALAREAGCHMVQLTTDKQRPDAVGFYRSLGFVDSHEGMKLHLR